MLKALHILKFKRYLKGLKSRLKLANLMAISLIKEGSIIYSKKAEIKFLKDIHRRCPASKRVILSKNRLFSF
jgi:hypothetical protein